MNGYSINAANVLLGQFAGQSVTVQNQGSITATDFYVGNRMAYNFLTTDAMANLNLNSATVTTASTGNVTGNASGRGARSTWAPT